jgi:hypothetical protein
MTESYIVLNPGPLRIRSARRQELSHAGEQPCIDRCTVQIHDTDDAAHVFPILDSTRRDLTRRRRKSLKIASRTAGT